MTSTGSFNTSPGPLDDVPGSLVHAAREGVITIDESQRIVLINPAAQRMFGCTAGEVLGCELSRFIPPRYRAAHAEHVRHFDASGVPERAMAENFSLTALRADGTEFPVGVTISRVDGTGAFAQGRFFSALVTDLSAQQGLKSRFDALWRTFQVVFELSPNAIWIAEGESIVFVNLACVELFAASSRSSLVGHSIYELMHPDSRATVKREVQRALAPGAIAPVLYERISRLDGEVRDVEIALAPLPDHGQSVLQMVISDLTQRKREAREAQRSSQALRGLSERLVEAREDERRRIARELHDELGQRLTALKMEIASVLPPLTSDERVDTMLEMLDETVASVRRIAADLRPLMLDDLGLNAAIEWLARDASRRMGIEVKVDLDDGDPPLGERATIALYRMVQEALTNVARHARATEVEIRTQQQRATLMLTVKDNGVGFPDRALQKEGSFGLMGIRERAYMLGGQMEVDNPPSGGGRLTVWLPLERQPTAIDHEPDPDDD